MSIAKPAAEDVWHGVRPSDDRLPVSVSPWRNCQIRACCERVLGGALLLLAAPLIGILIAAIRLASAGPGIYRQRRVGLGGRDFTMYKLRTMRIDAETRTGPVWACGMRDPRMTLLGRWLRRLHLDELPQLYNVARGEMALVGPRPERPEFVRVLATKIPGYLDRLAVKPGITGLAQINLPPDTDLASVRRKLVLDQEYIQTAGLLLDLRIVLCTVLRLAGLRGGQGVQLLGLQREVTLPEPDAMGSGDPALPPVAASQAAADSVSEMAPISPRVPLIAARG